MISIEEAQKIIISRSLKLKEKKVKLMELCGYVLAEDIYADRDYPPFPRSLMDGYAVSTIDFLKYQKKGFISSQSVNIGESLSLLITAGKCAKIMTGAPLPLGTDAVIAKEYLLREEIQGDKTIVFFSPSLSNNTKFKNGYNVAQQGEDVKANEKLMRRGRRIGPSDIASLSSIGVSEACVFSPPSYSIISTGREIVKFDQDQERELGKDTIKNIRREQIRDANFPILVSYLNAYKANLDFYTLVSDNNTKSFEHEIGNVLQSKTDIIIISGGVSVGDSDFVPDSLRNLGVDCLFHKVNIKPAKPFWFGERADGKVVFALPGNNFSVQVSFKIFIEPFLRASLLASPLKAISLPIAKEYKKANGIKDKRPEYCPCYIKPKGSLEICVPNSSGDIKAAMNSSGIALFLESHLKEASLVKLL